MFWMHDIYLDQVLEFLQKLSEEDQNKIAAATTAIREGKFDLVQMKQLKNKIRELKVKKFRLIFFIHERVVHFVRAFVKKSNKTPKKEIELAEKYYTLVINNINK